METIKVAFANLFGSVIGIAGMLVGTLGWAYWRKSKTMSLIAPRPSAAWSSSG
ncbi:hypothetical protein SAMN05444169_2943 [Bradyrhizobium erythrophlei]|jgi:hypothetical protein|uniref:Uncharacterized protein n=1 Tax=Bradyrhizobium erythrophlei TaxID=1437360 RepID=A0A1M5KLY2_9BRAD|nr:hypothetical protein SAMN05444169_2943 [Bradyrhizobium erythrophlei]